MSFDLCILASNLPDYKTALTLYYKLCEGEVPDVAPNRSLDRFYEELSLAFPEIDSLSEEEIEDSPWTNAHDRSNVHIIVCICWDRQLEIAPIVLEIAKRHQLSVLDPQSRTLHTI